MKNMTLQVSSTDMGKLTKLKHLKESHADDMLVIQQQQAIFNDATNYSSLSEDLRRLTSDASRHRHRSSYISENHESSRKTDSNHKSTEPSEKTSGKAKQSSSHSSNFSPNDTKTKTTTTLAISFSSPNLATNTSFSSGSDSSEFDGACGVTSVVKVQNLLDDACLFDEHEQNELESLNLAGENDVEYAELTQRMIPPSQKAQQRIENPGTEESDFMLMQLFIGSAESGIRSNEAESSSCNSSASSSSTAPRLVQSVLDHNLLFESTGATNELASSNAYGNNLDLPSELNQESALSLPPGIGCTSPVWKQVSHVLISAP